MADFIKAVEWMKQGKKVRRKVWAGKDDYWYVEYPEGAHSSIIAHHLHKKRDKVVDYFSTDLFLGKDWQIYREKK